MLHTVCVCNSQLRRLAAEARIRVEKLGLARFAWQLGHGDVEVGGMQYY